MDAYEPHQRWLGTTAVVSASGALDLLTSPALGKLLTSTLEQKPGGVIVDLTDVRFLGSAGMQVLVDAHEMATPDIGFVVVADGPGTSRPLKLVGLTEVFDVVATLQAATELLS
ncbi:STAS domain-containing protein [Mycobacterium sp. shizuoka-1]|uniref:STAS domain-containing protein n=1 Tax=Mycobacterium sp. shizuoka-1 TaxID=2039281 RepID=UPI000C065752|nr:STAS domain-containing protein [Mycobacterium sp. shizuoka-1]GAY16598.1 anti-sigma factor antagonist [Mycobacterium sp. shizuoka-1]